MKPKLLAAILLLTAMPAVAHRLDEYLQATLILVDKDRIEAEIRLTPGVAVLPIMLASIDVNADGVISETERTAYENRVRQDLSLTVDGVRLPLRLISSKFPTIAEMKDGLGEMQFRFIADSPPGGPHRKLIFENHHQSRIAAYLVNSLVPRDPDIRITAQNRNYQQSFYELDYLQAGVRSNPLLLAGLSNGHAWLGAAMLLLLTRLCFYWWRRRHSA